MIPAKSKVMNASVTCRDIARHLGVSAAAVSMALRNHPRVSRALVAKVQAAAKEMGWKPNPLVMAYQQTVRTGKMPRYQATIAWIDDLPKGSGEGLLPARRIMLEAAREQAAQSGYQMDHIQLDDLDKLNCVTNVARFRRVLESRGHVGLIIPLGWRPEHALLPWGNQAVALLGQVPQLIKSQESACAKVQNYHCVAPDYFANTRLAWETLQQRGCRRIGLMLLHYHHIMSDSLYEAAVLVQQKNAAKKVPPLILNEGVPLRTKPPEVFVQWMNTHRPDGILGANHEILAWLQAMDYRVPQDIKVAHLDLGVREKNWSGIDAQIGQQASATVDLILGQLMRNERETPANPKTVLIKGHWVEGRTT